MTPQAMLRKPRPFRGPFEVGQRVAYYRKRNAADGEGTNEGYRQGTIVAIEGQTVWVRNSKGRLVSAAKEQVRPLAGEEEWWSLPPLEQDLLKNSDQDLRDKHAPSAFRAPPDAVPHLAGDLRVAEGLDSALRGQELVAPAQRPALPLLDADGQPLPHDRIVHMISPLMIVPSTPKTTTTIPGTPPLKSPATPRRGRSRSKTPVPARTRQNALSPLPEDGAPVPSEPPALPSEPSALPSGPSPSDLTASGDKAPSEPHALYLQNLLRYHWGHQLRNQLTQTGWWIVQVRCLPCPGILKTQAPQHLCRGIWSKPWKMPDWPTAE